VIFYELLEYNEALKFLNKSISLDNKKSSPYANRAAVHMAKKDIITAIKDYKSALEIDDSNDYLLGQYVHAKMSICDWKDIEIEKNKIIKQLLDNKKISAPFPILHLIDDPKLQLIAAKIYSNNEYPVKKDYATEFNYKKEKIILGYFSADFTNHPISLLTIEMFELHDKDKFKIYGFSLKKYPECDIRKRLKKSFNEFYELENYSDLDISILSRKLKIDIAIDLGGHTKYSRPGIFSRRAASIQISYLGYLGTMGANYYDYIISDEILIPKESEHFYTEKIIYLPSYQCNDSKKTLQNYSLTKENLNLPDNVFIYCCFNNNFKISPECFRAWIDILSSVPQSILFLYADSPQVIKNLSNEASLHGISSERLFFSNRLSLELYYARFKVCDLFLDTWPYNAGTTASDALMTGLPVLTKIGNSFSSRMCSSILNSLYMNELSVPSLNDYIETAIRIGSDPIYYSNLKDKLLLNLKYNNPLFNTNEFVSSLENSYVEAFTRSLVNNTTSNIKLF
jgi:predicted O-linked N-acetylglucosamine transferase (SPINDLY family)